MKSKLKAPVTKCLNLRYDHLLSIFASNSNLRRYTMPVDAASYVFNVETVQVSGGGLLSMWSGGALSITGRADQGSLTVGDAAAAGGSADNSLLAAGQLVIDRFASIAVSRNGRASPATCHVPTGRPSTCRVPTGRPCTCHVPTGPIQRHHTGPVRRRRRVPGRPGGVLSRRLPGLHLRIRSVKWGEAWVTYKHAAGGGWVHYGQTVSDGQGLTIIHFPAQPDPFLTQNIP
jgi:hypothetical protein